MYSNKFLLFRSLLIFLVFMAINFHSGLQSMGLDGLDLSSLSLSPGSKLQKSYSDFDLASRQLTIVLGKKVSVYKVSKDGKLSLINQN